MVFFVCSTEMATRVKIVLVACLLLLMVLTEEVKPGLAKKGQKTKLKERVTKLEKSMMEVTKKMKEQEEELKEQKQKLEEQEERITQQEERIKEQDCNGKYTLMKKPMKSLNHEQCCLNVNWKKEKSFYH